ncbi:MAG: ferritin family protein [candidate division Zixibacteria bacterium]
MAIEMDIIEFALQMELDGRAFYTKGAETTSQPALKEIFTTLAAEEDRHYKFFKEMADGNTKKAGSLLGSTAYEAMKHSKNLFEQMADLGIESLSGDDEIELWNEALKMEEQAEQLYRDEATGEGDPARKKLLHSIADEEKSHIYLIDNILTFLKDPDGYARSKAFQSFMSWEGNTPEDW